MSHLCRRQYVKQGSESVTGWEEKTRLLLK